MNAVINLNGIGLNVKEKEKEIALEEFMTGENFTGEKFTGEKFTGEDVNDEEYHSYSDTSDDKNENVRYSVGEVSDLDDTSDNDDDSNIDVELASEHPKKIVYKKMSFKTAFKPTHFTQKNLTDY